MQIYEGDPYAICVFDTYIVVDIEEGEDSATYVLNTDTKNVSIFNIDNPNMPEEIIKLIEEIIKLMEENTAESVCLDETPQGVRDLIKKYIDLDIDFINV